MICHSSLVSQLIVVYYLLIQFIFFQNFPADTKFKGRLQKKTLKKQEMAALFSFGVQKSLLVHLEGLALPRNIV